MDWKITPKMLIISMLHVSNNRAMPIKVLIAMGRLFGFTSNTVRVTTTRLVADGRIENDERGLYRLKDWDTPISRFVDNWMSEESRVKEWDGFWICCLLPRSTLAQQRKNEKALSLIGFGQGLPQLWVRPNNLAMGLPEIRELLIHQGMDTDGEVFIGGGFEPHHVERWKRELWSQEEIIRTSVSAREQLERSMERLESLPVKDALVECYLEGTKGIHWILKDPLLPEEMIPSGHRIALTRTMLAYDAFGKGIWKQEFEGLRLKNSPSHAGLGAM
jgi:phenylacetic acid degradation operon negative regulatory protein